jgi:single-strand DNA-binding protein
LPTASLASEVWNSRRPQTPMPIPLLTNITLELVRRMARLYLRGIRGRPRSTVEDDESQIGGGEDEDQRPEPKAISQQPAGTQQNEVATMIGINEVVLSGVLAREGELRYTPEGKAILLFTLAGESLALHSHGEVRSVPFYLPVKLFGPRAEDFASLERGRGLLVHGALSYSSWQTAAGEKRSRLEVIAQTIFEVESGEVIEDASGGVRRLAGINYAVISGNLTRDVQSRSTNDGTSVAGLLLAVNERVKRHGQAAEQTHFVEVTLWGELADANAHLAKGAGVLAMGRLLNDSWTDREGHKRSALKLEGSHLETMTKKVVPPLGAFNPNRFSSPSPEMVASAATPCHSKSEAQRLPSPSNRR